MLLSNAKSIYINNKEAKEIWFGGSQIWTPTPVSTKTCLADYTWAEISEISKAGEMDNYFTIGETKDAIMSDGSTTTFCYVGQELDNDGLNAMTFVQLNNFTECKYYSSGSTWKSYIYTTIRNSSESAISGSDVKEYARTVKKYYQSKNSSTTKSSTTCEGWVPSVTELFGVTMSCDISNGVTYPYCTTAEFQSQFEYSNYFWVRDSDSTGYAYTANEKGSKSLTNWTYTRGLVVAFCI